MMTVEELTRFLNEELANIETGALSNAGFLFADLEHPDGELEVGRDHGWFDHGFTIDTPQLARAVIAKLREQSPAALDMHEERQRQDAKWGEQNHPDGTGSSVQPLYGNAIVGEWSKAETLAEVFTMRTDVRATGNGDRPLSWLDILLEEVFEASAESDPAKLRAELIQVAAVATQWAEAIDRRASRE